MVTTPLYFERQGDMRSPIMKYSKWIVGVLVLSSGCSTMNNTEAGAANGAVIGGVTGALIGAVATRNPLGALIGLGAGAAAGAGGGALAGHSVDRAQERQVQAINSANENAIYAAQYPVLSLEQIRDMTQNGVSDAIIVNQIYNTGSTYLLSAEQITWLRAQRVSDYVISVMQSRGPQVMTGAVVAPRPALVPAVGVGVVIR
jgi:hypothetical protein